MQVYLPTRNSPSFGVVRTVVKDGMDAPEPRLPTENRVFLDSDGQVNNLQNGPKNKVHRHLELCDDSSKDFSKGFEAYTT